MRALGFRSGDEVLVPAYHQGAEIEAFRRSDLACRFYRLDDRLEPVESDLVRLTGPRTRGLHLIHYWGFPQQVDRWRAWCDERGLFLIEDGAQALLASSGGKKVGTVGDLAVFCLYKSFGLPDGAAAICRATLPRPRARSGMGLGPMARRVGSALTARSPVAAGMRALLIREPEEARAEGAFLPGELELGDPGRRPTTLCLRFLTRVVDPAAAERRREHYAFLLDRLRARVPPPFEELCEGAVPIAFPFVVGNAPLQAATLRRQGVVAGILWPTRHTATPPGEWGRADFFRSRVLALPVHQELTAGQLERIADRASRLPSTA